MDFLKEAILDDVDSLITKIELHSGNIGKVKSKEFIRSLKRLHKDMRKHKFPFAERRRCEKVFIKEFGIGKDDGLGFHDIDCGADIFEIGTGLF